MSFAAVPPNPFFSWNNVRICMKFGHSSPCTDQAFCERSQIVHKAKLVVTAHLGFN